MLQNLISPNNNKRSQIGRSMSNESFQSSMNLQRAIEEANRLTVTQPTPQPSPDTNDNRATYSGSNVLQLLNTMKEEEEEEIQAGSHWSDDDITGSEITPKFNQPSGDHFIHQKNHDQSDSSIPGF